MSLRSNARTLACLAVLLLVLPSHAQSASPAFESASVKPAPPDAPMEGLGFMIGLSKHTPPHGLLTMTGPLAPFIMFAYDVQDEVEARAMRSRLPEWAQRQKFAIVARPPENAQSMEDIRLMLRSLLEDRFVLKAHRETHTAQVTLLATSRPGTTGPSLRPHDPTQVCVQQGTQATTEPGKPAPVLCGLDIFQRGGSVHVSMIDVTLPEACTLFGGLAGVLGGRGMDRVVDSTGLNGRWDMTLDFVAERDGPAADSGMDTSGPTFTAALEKQLGLRLKKGTGQVEELIVDHIAQPTPD